MTYDIVLHDGVGVKFNDAVVSNDPLGGSEFVLWQLAGALHRQGLRVLVVERNVRGKPERPSNGPHYVYGIPEPVTCKWLVQHRYSEPAPEIRADRTVTLASDTYHPVYARPHVVPHPVVWVSAWQQATFPTTFRGTVIPNPLPDHVYTRPIPAKDPHVFLYASAALKGLDATLREWARLRTETPGLHDARLRVLSPGYDLVPEAAGHVPGVRVVGGLPFHKVVAEMDRAAGLFYVNDFPETFCIVAALAEARGARCHVWQRNGGAIPITVNDPLVVDAPADAGQEAFVSRFLAAYGTVGAHEGERARYPLTEIARRWSTFLASLE